ncbi:hypothetical protein JOM56_000440 [Amanita muscaria]
MALSMASLLTHWRTLLSLHHPSHFQSLLHGPLLRKHPSLIQQAFFRMYSPKTTRTSIELRLSTKYSPRWLQSLKQPLISTLS